MTRTTLLLLFVLIGQVILQDMRAMRMWKLVNVKFQCTNSSCLPSTIVNVPNERGCQMACLARGQCGTASFYRSTGQCEMFTDTPRENGYLSAQVDGVTMIAINNTKIISAQTTLATTEVTSEATTVATTTEVTSEATTVATTTEVTSEATTIQVTSEATAVATTIEITSEATTLASTTSACEVFPTGRSPTIGWLFQNNLIDHFGVYNGTGQNNPTYGLGRNGCGKCLNLTKSLQQYVTVNSTPYVDLRSISFSVEAWIKPTVIGDGIEHVIFGQCASTSVRGCLRNSISATRVMSFLLYGDTQSGSIIVPVNVWSHVAYVYNLTALTMSLYFNGTLDTSGGSHGPYSGVPYNLEIGNVAVYDTSVNLTYGGCIDEIWFYPFARTAVEISGTFALG